MAEQQKQHQPEPERVSDGTLDRAAEARESQARVEHWVPPAILETPPPPEGFVYRWIRSELAGKDDTRNVASAMREGFEPVRIQDLSDTYRIEFGLTDRGDGVVRVNELILCKQPKHLADQRERYYANKVRNMQHAVDQQFKGEGAKTANMNVHIERKTTVSKGRPKFQEDD